MPITRSFDYAGQPAPAVTSMTQNTDTAKQFSRFFSFFREIQNTQIQFGVFLLEKIGFKPVGPDLNKLEDELIRTEIFDFTGITDEKFINSALLKHISDRKIHTLILSQCGLTDFPKALLENNFKKISSLQLNDNPHLIELPENIDSMFPNLTYLDISGTGINQSDGIIRLANKELQIINFKNTPLEEDKCKNELISILKKNKYPVKFYDDSSIKIRTPESKTDSASVKKKRSVLLNSAPSVELIMPFSQSKGRPDIVLPDGICAAVCMAASLDFLADNEVEGFLKKLYPNFSKSQRKGRINLSYVKNLIELQGRIDSSTTSASYLEQRNMKYSTLRSFPATKSALLVNFLQKKVWDTTEIKAINITLDFTNQSSHRIAFLISNEKNNTGEKAVYFVEANIGMFKIWLKKDSDQLARFFLKYVSPSIQRHKTSEFRVYEVKKTAA